MCCCCPWVVVLGEVRPQDPVTLAWADGLKCRSSSGKSGWGDAQDRAVLGHSIGAPSSLDLGPVGHLLPLGLGDCSLCFCGRLGLGDFRPCLLIAHSGSLFSGMSI